MNPERKPPVWQRLLIPMGAVACALLLIVVIPRPASSVHSASAMASDAELAALSAKAHEYGAEAEQEIEQRVHPGMTTDEITQAYAAIERFAPGATSGQ